MASEFEVRDPIHGFIYRGSREKKIIDSPLFQRLRRIKQLALASLVYPSAVHTRFEHSIGAMHVAGRIAERLDLGNEHRQILRFAALLHDIGHGPFSHVSEEVLRNVTGSKQAHEEIGYRIILNSPDLDGPLSRDERREIVDLLSGRGGDSVMRSILSGPIDADKQDYLSRDSYFCGVKYGVYDIDCLIQVLCVHSDTNDRFLAISQDGVQTLEQFVIARYHMNGQVYRHHVRLITDAMIGRGIQLGIELDGINWLRNLYSFDESDEYLQAYLGWEDERLVRELLTGPDGYAKTMFQRLQDRHLFKRIFRVDLKDLEPISRQILLEEDPLKRNQIFGEIERGVASIYTNLDEKLVISKVVKQKSAGQTEAAILVKCDDGEPREFRDMSTLFRSIDMAIQDQYLEIYAPQDWSDSDKKRRREQFKQDILPMVNSLLKARGRLPEGSTINAEGGSANEHH